MGRANAIFADIDVVAGGLGRAVDRSVPFDIYVVGGENQLPKAVEDHNLIRSYGAMGNSAKEIIMTVVVGGEGIWKADTGARQGIAILDLKYGGIDGCAVLVVGSR